MKIWVLFALAGCATGAASGPLVPETPTLASRCRIGASQTSVYVTEWSATEKANLQGALSGGAIAVSYSGCEMRIVPNCKLPGAYNWQRTTPTSERLEIKNDAELYAKLPLGAVTLDGELKKSGELAMITTVSGQARLVDMEATRVPSDPSCSDATHLVSSLSVGAFTLTAGGSERMGGGVGVAKGSLDQSAKVLRSAGTVESCSQATDESPAWDCASPLQVFLSPIPGKAEAEGPAGSVQVDFVSSHDNIRFDVIINDDAACTTPCKRYLDPTRPITLRSREEAPTKLAIPRLTSGTGPLQITAHPKNWNRWSAGFVVTGLGGSMVLGGLFFAGFGGLGDRDGLVLGGEITAGLGVVALVPGIYLMLKARARVDVRARGGGGAIMIAPGGIVGSF